ncbi:MAG: DNA-binding protein [Acidobacteriia bacterium]|nr:DNA-binding protein [Terriglobia bacterium]
MRRSTAALPKAKNRPFPSMGGGHSAENAREALAQAFLKRSVKMLQRVISSASSEALKSALSSPTDVGGVATLLSDLAPLDADLSAVDPFVEAMARGAAIKQELLTNGGGGLTSSQVSSALGITRQAVDKRRIRHALLAVPNGSGEYLYPACQFTSAGVIPNLEEVLRAFQIRSPWTQLSALLAPAPALGGKTILEALKSGGIERAIAIAASFGEQAA